MFGSHIKSAALSLLSGTPEYFGEIIYIFSWMFVFVFYKNVVLLAHRV